MSPTTFKKTISE
jgi:hypothetical protein